jgi:hypothetical protein
LCHSHPFFFKARSNFSTSRRREFCIIASGDSLTIEDCELVKEWRSDVSSAEKKVIVINSSFKIAKWADILYACDGEWWDKYYNEVNDVFQGSLYTICDRVSKIYGINWIASEDQQGLGEDIIHTGNNSGYQSINLAYLLGAKKIILLGFDMQRSLNKGHWHGDHPGSLNRHNNFTGWLKKFPKLAEDLKNKDVEVINSTRLTALTCFKMKPLKEALC